VSKVRGSRSQHMQGAQVVRKALAILRILAAGRETGVPLSEVVQATGIVRPTAYRLVHVLMDEGLVERRASGRYAIGRQVPELALARTSPSRLLVVAEPFLTEASAKLGDTLFLTVRTGNDALCVRRKIGSYPVQVLSIDVGARRPLGVSSAGIAILATLPAREVRRILRENQSRFDAYRTTTPDILRQVSAARGKGYFVREIGLVQGTKSLSTWISGTDGWSAALTLSAIRSRLNPRREPEVAEIMQTAAKSIHAGLFAHRSSGAEARSQHKTAR
jgi:DNA-binding IclR family transcriptional regulator